MSRVKPQAACGAEGAARAPNGRGFQGEARPLTRLERPNATGIAGGCRPQAVKHPPADASRRVTPGRAAGGLQRLRTWAVVQRAGRRLPFLESRFSTLVAYRCRCSEPGRWCSDRGHHLAPACGGLDNREGEPPEGWGNPAGVPRPLGRKDGGALLTFPQREGFQLPAIN